MDKCLPIISTLQASLGLRFCAGAGPGWHGRSGVHTHMTNTRITDPEILERRYPVVLREFSLRPGSGGDGRWHGGDGVVREVSHNLTFCRSSVDNIEAPGRVDSLRFGRRAKLRGSMGRSRRCGR